MVRDISIPIASVVRKMVRFFVLHVIIDRKGDRNSTKTIQVDLQYDTTGHIW